MIMRRDTVDYAEFVPGPCKEICRVNNGLYTEWEAKNCNKEVTDDCNKTMCKYVDSQLECAECQMRNSGDENVVSEDDIDQSKDEARRQCQQLGYPTKL
ncbi:hypothetical protein A1Q2_04604 [Trichosporon asahii var. asahii CBS 8904]|uniref:Uncharacterized protein n=2 Tax=Trichosporon asahii var. asahii TaxID=189963 RepID=K1VK35_TRIAC|nr:hypothetical protein A1Q2_04604 [Trichosporon asahii var. asahii CBS 8904]